VVYSSSGKAVTIWVDENFNGLEEVEYLYSPTEELIARYEDREEDGYVEEYTRYAPDSLFIYRDADQDGFYAPSEMIRAALRD